MIMEQYSMEKWVDECNDAINGIRDNLVKVEIEVRLLGKEKNGIYRGLAKKKFADVSEAYDKLKELMDNDMTFSE